MNTNQFRLAGCAVACLLQFTPGGVLAQTAADRATARALAEEGYGALTRQQFDVAADRFRRADGLVHAPTFVVEEGRALIGLKHYVQAEERFELVLREGVADSAPLPWKTALADAAKLLDEVKPKLAWLTISVGKCGARRGENRRRAAARSSLRRQKSQ